MSTIKLLLVIQDDAFYDLLKSDADFANCKVFYAADAKAASDYIKSTHTQFNCIFINPKITTNEDINLIQECHEYRTGVPLYTISQELTELGNNISLNDAGIHGIVKNRDDFLNVTKTIEKALDQFDAETAMNLSEKTPDPVAGQEGDVLTPINAGNFLSGNKSFFDLFVKIREDKFIKILNARDYFDYERIEQYLKKGLKYFWIKKSAQKFYIDYCGKLTHKIITAKNVSSDVKVSMTLNQGTEVLAFIDKNGVGEEAIQFATEFSNNITTLVKNIANENKAVASLLKNIAAFEHSAGTAFICGLMGRVAQLETNELLNDLGLAATLHDIGLFKDRSIYQDNEEEDHKIIDELDIETELLKEIIPSMRKKEILKIYHEHPLKGAEICSTIKSCSPIVTQIIVQHHERTNGTGFPSKINGPLIHPLAQILGVADEFSKLIRRIATNRAKKEELALFPAKLEGFSSKTIKIWENTFIHRGAR